jgi:hypothetical protein
MVTRLTKQKMSDSRHARPIVEDPALPQMTDTPGKARRINGKILEMPMEPKLPAGSANRMDPLPKRGRPKATGRRATIGEQEEMPPRARADTPGAEAEGRGYVRLRVRVAGDDLSVEGIKRVPGPVLAHEPLHGELAYEVTVGDRPIASGSVPDAAMIHAYPHPDPAPGQEGHHFEPTSTYEFMARIPDDQVTLKSLPRVNVAVYRIKEPVDRREELVVRGGPETVASERVVRSLSDQYPRELRVVGRLNGIKLDDLPDEVREQARRALR